MLRKIFGIDSSFTSTMGKIADIVLVSMLWIVCSLPVVTIALSTSALYYAVVKGIRKERGTPTHEFLNFFKQNWRQGIKLGLLYIALGVLAAFNIYAVSRMDKSTMLYSIYQIESLWIALMFVFLSLFLFPVFSRFEYNAWDCVKTSLFIAVRHTVSSMFMGAAVIGTSFVTAKYPILAVFLPAFMLMVFSLRIEKIFRKYMKEPKEDEIIPWYWDDGKMIVQDDEKEEVTKK